MLNIKHGQAEISEYIKSDISDKTVKEALNSGKRLAALVALRLKCLKTAASVEYIHNGLLLLEDMELNRPKRRGVETIHVKHGYAKASKISTYLIAKGLEGASAEVHKCVSEMIMLTLKTPDETAPIRVKKERLNKWHGAGGIFSLAFMMSTGPDTASIGESLGVCYYLCMQKDKDNDKIDMFTENMRQVVTQLTLKHLWNPLIKEIVNFIISRFKSS
jgi:hypothetical protein